MTEEKIEVVGKIKPLYDKIGQLDVLTIEVKCPFCDKNHFHGGGNNVDNPDLGWRLSHCFKGSYFITGEI